MTNILTRLTLQDYVALPETNLPTEVADGVLVVTAMASPRHQRVAARLIVLLHQTLAATRPDLEVYGPAEWLLRRDPLLVRQPDVVVAPRAVADAGQPRLTEPPLLVVEVLSADSVERDLVVKRREYLAAGLGHYWVVDLELPAIVGFDRRGAYAQAEGDQPFTVAEPVPFRVVPGELVG